MSLSPHKRIDQAILWNRYVKGDRSAFGDLYSIYHRSLTAFCLGRLKNIVLAENAASETLIKLLQHDRPEEIENFESWLFTVAKNECNNVWSTAERRRKLIEKNYEFIEIQSAEIESKFTVENFEKLLHDHLPDVDYKIWKLMEQGYHNHEIAVMMGMQEKTIANRKSVIRMKLKEVLKNNFLRD